MRLKKKTFSKQASVVGAGVGAARVGTGAGAGAAVGAAVAVVAAAANWSERQLKINAFVPRKLNLLLCQKLFKLELMLSHKKNLKDSVAIIIINTWSLMKYPR